MHYKNGREAKAGDVVVVVNGHTVPVSGVLHSVQPGSDTCNGRLAQVAPSDPYINIKDCLHIDDVRAAEVPDSTK